MVRASLESPAQPEVVALIEALDAYQVPLYPIESHHGIDVQALAAPNVLFAVARSADGRAVGCGAVVLTQELGELKRMYTEPGHRGSGVAQAVLALLESEARSRGVAELALETGYLQGEALAFYGKHGYRRCGPFGAYTDDPNSVFMRKRL
ncbi:MAG: GNAT family N-acetyltransferase [Burkholderiales bacterium]|nr:GNAT family N-acetyltransferase [Burkholderiales bacterium]